MHIRLIPGEETARNSRYKHFWYKEEFDKNYHNLQAGGIFFTTISIEKSQEKSFYRVTVNGNSTFTFAERPFFTTETAKFLAVYGDVNIYHAFECFK